MTDVQERPQQQVPLLRYGGKMFINNTWVAAKSGKTLDVFDPSTGSKINIEIVNSKRRAG